MPGKNSTHVFSSDFTLGILGGGQLGKMLIAATRRMDIAVSVLDPSPDAPCSIGSNRFTVGDFKDYDTVYQFGKTVDALTIEIEHVNIDALEALEKEGLPVYPSPRVLRIIQDKSVQKDFYIQNHIPTAPYQKFNGKKALLEAVEKGDIPGESFVWKADQGGYDGRGVQVVHRKTDIDQIPDVPCIVEDLIPFKTELAVIVARSTDGHTRTYPVVEMEFHPVANQVEYVLCPARISEEIARKAHMAALKTAEAFGTAGVMAVEMFLTQSDEILVNETAPRVHNSGHYSIEGAYTSQFEQHIRAVLGLPLGDPQSKVPAVMVNLVGEEGFFGDVLYDGIEHVMAMDGVSVHIYGKRQTRPFRKMGHITVTAPDIASARSTAEKVKQTIRVISKPDKE